MPRWRAACAARHERGLQGSAELLPPAAQLIVAPQTVRVRQSVTLPNKWLAGASGSLP